MSSIHLLSPDLINKIAAGEVVERPASAVKELIENSLDAGADEITVNLEEGGLKKIEIIDNGKGMDKIDAKMAFIAHATSKIHSESDLQAINTLGFRGEALASIASIADVTLHTYNGLEQPYTAYSQNAEIITEIGQGRAQGTTITINNIYNKVPARRKFLRNSNTEYKYILDVFTFMALSHPAVAFKLIKDGKTILNLNAEKELIPRITTLFPGLTPALLLPVNYDSPKLKISGFIGHPASARQDASQQFSFINQRYVKDSLIAKAIKDAYASTLMTRNYPVYFLFFELNPDSIDVNIHPRKLEVKYSDPSAIFMATKITVENSLKKTLQSNFIQQVEDDRLGGSQSGIGTTWQGNLAQGSRPLIKQSLDFSQQLLSNPRVISQDFTITERLIQEHEVQIKNPSQVFNTYIIFERQEKLLIVDQHAADERVNFEKIMSELNNNKDTNIFETLDLLIPLSISLTSTEQEIARSHYSIIEKYGFKFKIQAHKAEITSVPLILKSKFTENTFKELLADLGASDDKKGNAMEKQKEHVVATLACHASIRAGQTLSAPEMEQLIINLFECQLPYSCPHGRPIIWELSKYDLEKNFKRKL